MESKFIRVHDLLLQELDVIKEERNNEMINNVEATKILIEELQKLKSMLLKNNISIDKPKGRL